MKEDAAETTKTFKKCSMCSKIWRERGDFLADPEVAATGYLVNFKELELGLFLFNHKTCKTTLAIHASEFTDLYDGPVYESRLEDTEDCPEYCLNINEMKPCPAKCECAYVREVLDQVANWRKSHRGREIGL